MATDSFLSWWGSYHLTLCRKANKGISQNVSLLFFIWFKWYNPCVGGSMKENIRSGSQPSLFVPVVSYWLIPLVEKHEGNGYTVHICCRSSSMHSANVTQNFKVVLQLLFQKVLHCIISPNKNGANMSNSLCPDDSIKMMQLWHTWTSIVENQKVKNGFKRMWAIERGKLMISLMK